MKNPLLLLSLLVTVGVFLSSSPVAAQEQKDCKELTPYVVDIWPQPLSYPAWVAVSLEETKKRCLDVQFTSVRGVAAKIQAFAAGKLHAAIGAEILLEPGITEARYMYAFANESPFVLVGRGTHVSDLQGEVTLVPRCTWEGDITLLRTDPAKGTAANPTEPLRAYLLEQLPADSRIFCLAGAYREPSDDPDFMSRGPETVYLKAMPGSKNRRDALLSGAANFAALSSEFAQITLDEYSPDKGKFNVVVNQAVLPQIPSALLTVRKDKDMDLHLRFIAAVKQAMKRVMDDESTEINRITQLMIVLAEKTPFNLFDPGKNYRQQDRMAIVKSRLQTNFDFGFRGGMWSLSGCISVEGMENYRRIMHAPRSVGDMVTAGSLCRQ